METAQAGATEWVVLIVVIAVLLVALAVVHPDWSLEQGQFAWWMLVIFASLTLTGPGPYRLPLPWQRLEQQRGA